MLPKIIVVPFSDALPIAESCVGLLLITGLFTKQALIAGGIVMIALNFGTAQVENREALPSQLIHVFAEVDNLFDADYSDLPGARLPGRWAMGGLRVSIK